MSEKQINGILYARFSPRPKSDECESVEKQIERLKAYCVAMNINVVAIEYDKAKSGARADNRPGFQRACKRACKEKAVMIVTALDRLARSTKDAIESLELLGKQGANIISLRESIDTTKPIGKFIFTIFSALAQMQRETMSIATSDAMMRHQANGRRMGRSDRIPYGFKADPKNKKRIIADKDESEVIEQILSKAILEGMGPYQICIALNREGIKHRKGDWMYSHIKSILKRAG